MQNPKEPHAVCVCTDANLLVPALFVAQSARTRIHGTGKSYDVILVTNAADITPEARQWIKEKGIKICDRLDLSSFKDIKIRQRRLTAATFIRLLLAEHLAGRYKKILYLDADVVIHEEIASIFRLDTAEFPVAAVPSGRIWQGSSEKEHRRYREYCQMLGMTEPYRYINAGVLLIDVDKWNRDEIGKRALHFIKQKGEALMLPDEDALNSVLDGRQAELSPLWNMRSAVWSHKELREFASPVIVHYDGPYKPWKRFGFGRRLFEFESVYREYQAFIENSPWTNYLKGQWNFADLLNNTRFELNHLASWMGLKPTAITLMRRPAYMRAFLQFCAKTQFADVDQGIVSRENGKLNLTGT